MEPVWAVLFFKQVATITSHDCPELPHQGQGGVEMSIAIWETKQRKRLSCTSYTLEHYLSTTRFSLDVLLMPYSSPKRASSVRWFTCFSTFIACTLMECSHLFMVHSILVFLLRVMLCDLCSIGDLGCSIAGNDGKQQIPNTDPPCSLVAARKQSHGGSPYCTGNKPHASILE